MKLGQTCTGELLFPPDASCGSGLVTVAGNADVASETLLLLDDEEEELDRLFSSI